jgi:hypothetical protein
MKLFRWIRRLFAPAPDRSSPTEWDLVPFGFEVDWYAPISSGNADLRIRSRTVLPRADVKRCRYCGDRYHVVRT